MYLLSSANFKKDPPRNIFFSQSMLLPLVSRAIILSARGGPNIDSFLSWPLNHRRRQIIVSHRAQDFRSDESLCGEKRESDSTLGTALIMVIKIRTESGDM